MLEFPYMASSILLHTSALEVHTFSGERTQSQSTSIHDGTKRKYLGRLPREITETILEYVVMVPQSVMVSFPALACDSGGIVFSSEQPPLPKAIFHVNHDLRHGSVRALLRSNRFSIFSGGDMKNMSKWLAKVPDGFANIRSLTLGLKDFCDEPARRTRADVQLIQACPGLKELRFFLATENVVDFRLPGSAVSYQTFGKWRPPRPLKQLIQLFDVSELLRLPNLKEIILMHHSGGVWVGYATDCSKKLANWLEKELEARNIVVKAVGV